MVLLSDGVNPKHSTMVISALMLAGAFFLLALFSIGISQFESSNAALWLPNSVAVAWILLRTRAEQHLHVAAILMANALAYSLYEYHWLLLIGGSIANALEVVVACYLIRLLCHNYSQLTVWDATLVLFCYTVIAAPIAALIGAWATASSSATQWGETFFNWWLGDVIGAFLLLLPSMAFNQANRHLLLQGKELLSMLLLLVVLLVVAFLALTYIAFPMVYIALPLMFVAVIKGMLRAAILANLVYLLLGAGLYWGWWDFPVLHEVLDVRGVWAAGAAVVFAPVILGIAMDEIRRRQHELLGLTERLNLASKTVELALWDWNIESGDIFWDERMRQLYGIGPEDKPLRVTQWRTRLHPDDIASAEGSLNDALDGRADYRAQFRIRNDDGSYRSLQASGMVMRNSHGRPVRMVGMNWDVSELVSAQHAVANAQEQLNSVVEAASEFSIIATDQQGVIEVFSAGAEGLLGYRKEDVIGKLTPAAFHMDEEVKREGRKLSAECGHTIEGFDVFVEKPRHGIVESKEWTYIRKDGTAVPVNLTVTSIKDANQNVTGYLGVARDITQQKIAEKGIKAAHSVLEQQIKLAQQMRDEFESLFELAPGAMLVLDDSGRVMNANSRAHQLFGYDEKLETKHIKLLLPGINTDDNEKANKTLNGVRADRSPFMAAIEFSPLLLNGVIHTIVIVYDITAQKEAEQALQRSRDLAESANRAKTEFLANMSHEIRTPLNAVLGASQLLSYTALNNQQSNYVGMISAAGQALLALLNDVLDVSKIEAGKMELAHSAFSLSEVIEPLATIMSANAVKKNLELVIQLDSNIPRFLIGDATRLQQVLVNLSGNAIKFTPEGEVVVSFYLHELQNQKAVIDVRVRDTGIGMSQDQQDRLFTAFSQADTSITRRFGGTGLGLTICKKLVELMQGTISLSSQPGVGTEFFCQLTLAVDTTKHDANVESTALDSKRVLIADRNLDSQQALRTYCESWGWQCVVVSSVEDVFKKIGETHYIDVFDVLVCNQNLLNVDHLLELAGDIPCVKLVGMIAKEEVIAQRADNTKLVLLAKPVTASSLLDGINEALARFFHPSMPVQIRRHGALQDLSGARILLVEDTLSNQTIIISALEQARASVQVANNGEEAIACLRKAEPAAQNFDVILMDVQMPVMDGFTATRVIREELHIAIPIIAITAGVLAFERQQCIESGMTDFIGKPLDIPTMLATIAKYIPKTGRQQSVPGAVGKVVLEHAPVADTPEVKDGVFNPERILKFVRGKPARENEVIEMIERVVSDGLTPLHEGTALIEQGHHEEAVRHFHTLKGTMGNFGADKVMQAAQALEQAIKQSGGVTMGSVTVFTPLLTQFEAATREMLEVAKCWLEQYYLAKPSASAETNVAVLDLKSLQMFKEQLSQSNIDAIDAYQQLKPALEAVLDMEHNKGLRDAMNDLRFDDALSFIRDL